jgi:hypothetical protein
MRPALCSPWLVLGPPDHAHGRAADPQRLPRRSPRGEAAVPPPVSSRVGESLVAPCALRLGEGVHLIEAEDADRLGLLFDPGSLGPDPD